jgi:Transposase, Mutator family
MVVAKGHTRTVVLNQSALLEVLDAPEGRGPLRPHPPGRSDHLPGLIEAELTAVIGAAPHQRTPERLAQRNGHRPRLLSTTAGIWSLRIPKLRAGSFFPSLLERRRRVDRALVAVVMRASLHGVEHSQGRRLGPRAWRRQWHLQKCGLPGSAPTSTKRWPRSGLDRWPASASRPCSWPPPTARSGSTTSRAKAWIWCGSGSPKRTTLGWSARARATSGEDWPLGPPPKSLRQ